MVKKALQSLTPSDIVQVYVGQARKCCCGCKGVHSYSSEHQAEASESHGYQVDNIDDVAVIKVLRTVQANEEIAEFGSNHVAVSIGPKARQKIYIVYFHKNVEMIVPAV